MDAIKGNTAMPHIQTAGQLIPCVVMSTQAVVAIRPPTVLLALQRFRSPFVLKTSVTSKRSKIFSTLSMEENEGAVFLPVIVNVDVGVIDADAVKAYFEERGHNQEPVA